ncbi:recombinase family protein [Gracilibacillus kekensis]|nr:recombinase family protein [Gracilibacillus kekensis]
MLPKELDFTTSTSFNSSNNEERTKQVAIYARVSTTEQAEEGYSIDEQTRILRKYCEHQGYEVHKEYVDRGVSGKSVKGRASLQQLLSDANEKRFDIVLVWKSNRLARNILDMLQIVDFLKQQNIAFRSYSEKYETETPTGKLQFNMMAVIAEFERDNIAENVKMGMIARAKEGSWNGGRVLGYDSIKVPTDNHKKTLTKLVVNEKEASTVRRIFQLYTEGNGYKSITNTLNKEGHVTKKGNMFSISGIKTILTNPVYVGYIRYNVRRDWSEKRRNNINPDPVIEKGKHDPIIDDTTWQKVQSIMRTRAKRPNRVHSGEFPLTGIMKCPACGAGMVLGRTTNRKKDGTKRVLEYYVCGAWKNKGTAACRSNGIRTAYADEYVFNKIAQFAADDRLIHDLVQNVNSSHRKVTEPLEREFRALSDLMAGIQSKKEKALTLFEENIISKSDLKERFQKLDEEKVRLEDRIQAIQQQLGQDGKREISYEMVKVVMSNFVNSFKNSITAEQRKQLLHLLIRTISIGDDRKIETIQIQFNNDLLSHFKQGEAKSSGNDDFASPFCIYFNL